MTTLFGRLSAFILVVALAGCASTPDGTETADSVEPSVAASPAPSDGSRPAGPHVLWDDPEIAIAVTIPGPGWYGTPGGGILANVPEEEAFPPDGAGMIGPFVTDLYVPADPCQWSTTMPDTPSTTVDEVVAALQGQASRDPSAPMDITVDGHAGKSIVLHVPDDAVFGKCDQTKFCTLSEDTAAACSRYHQFPGQIDEMLIVDVNGELMVIDAMYSDATPAEDVAELRAILDTITFEEP